MCVCVCVCVYVCVCVCACVIKPDKHYVSTYSILYPFKDSYKSLEFRKSRTFLSRPAEAIFGEANNEMRNIMISHLHYIKSRWKNMWEGNLWKKIISQE